jgi:four helix bundle protein
MHRFRELKVWQRALAFTAVIYRESGAFPSDERFGLTSQIRRAVCGISLNIAEGAGCSSDKDFCRFLSVALRQGYETITATEIARRLGYWSDDVCDRINKEADEIIAMTVGLMKSLGWPFDG